MTPPVNARPPAGDMTGLRASHVAGPRARRISRWAASRERLRSTLPGRRQTGTLQRSARRDPRLRRLARPSRERARDPIAPPELTRVELFDIFRKALMILNGNLVSNRAVCTVNNLKTACIQHIIDKPDSHVVFLNVIGCCSITFS